MKKKTKKNNNGIQKNSKDISLYLELFKSEFEASRTRKKILENKAYLLGTVLFFFISFNHNFFVLFDYNKNIYEKEIIIIIVFKLIAIILFCFSFFKIAIIIKPSNVNSLIITNLDLEEKEKLKKLEQQIEIAEYYGLMKEQIDKITTKQGNYLKEAFISSVLFWIIYFIFLIGFFCLDFVIFIDVLFIIRRFF